MSWLHVLLGMWLVVCAGYALVSAGVAFEHPLLDAHVFRQTHTAISALFMVDRAPTLAYETPVVGPPWSIPFEFPIYQWLVAGLVSACDTPLDQTGRLVSLLFFWLTLIPLYRVLAVFDLRPAHRLLVLSLLLINPFYLFWSRTFMIEAAALFFAVAFLASVVTHAQQRRRRDLVFAAVLGALAGLQKITTFLPFLGLALLVLWAHRDTKQRAVISFAVIAAVSLGITMAWTLYADALKEQNPIGTRFTSTNLAWWNFGTFDMRLDGDYLYHVILRQPLEAVYDEVTLLACLLGALLARRLGRAAALCAALYVAVPLVFARLHGHTYYAFASLHFLVVAMALCALGLIQRADWRRVAGLGLFVAIAATGIYRHQTLFLPLQTRSPDVGVAAGEAIARLTEPEDVIIVYGDDWSSRVPYYARRRALAPPTLPTRHHLIEQALDNLAQCRVGAMVLFDRATATGHYPAPDEIERQLERFGLSKVPSFCSERITIHPRVEFEPIFTGYQTAEQLLRTGHNKQALTLLDQTIEKMPDEPSFYVARATAHLQLGDLERMLADCERAIAHDAHRPERFRAAAWLCSQAARVLGDDMRGPALLLQAQGFLDRALATDPNHVDTLLDRAKVREKLGDEDGMRADRERALHLRNLAPRHLDHFARVIHVEYRSAEDPDRGH